MVTLVTRAKLSSKTKVTIGSIVISTTLHHRARLKETPELF